MDLILDVEDYKLSIRVGCIIIHNNKVLVHRNINSDYCYLSGERIEIGENSETAIKRELQEELEKEIKIEEYVSTIENFFEMNGKKYHEIYFIHKVEFLNDEEKEFLKYEWINIDEIENVNFVPK